MGNGCISVSKTDPIHSCAHHFLGICGCLCWCQKWMQFSWLEESPWNLRSTLRCSPRQQLLPDTRGARCVQQFGRDGEDGHHEVCRIVRDPREAWYTTHRTTVQTSGF